MKTIIYSAIISGIVLCSVEAGATCMQENQIPSSTPDGQFVDHGDNTVTDTKTGLMWAKCVLGQTGNSCTGTASKKNWQDALQAAKDSRLATYSDWRVPNVKELLSIIEWRCINPSINLNIFPNTPYGYYFSSSPDTHFQGTYAWEVNFFHGAAGDSGYIQTGKYVRLVRSTQ